MPAGTWRLKGIDVSVCERDGVLYANVQATDHDEPYTWLRVVREFLAIKYCVQVR
jgi:hypothetical protein